MKFYFSIFNESLLAHSHLWIWANSSMTICLRAARLLFAQKRLESSAKR